VSRSALKACPILRRRLVQGSIIVNVDPVVFEILIDYLSNNGTMDKVRARKPLERLVGGSDMMLKLAKAWHIAEMLDLMALQNTLVDTYRVLYLKLRNSRTRMPLNYEPFSYLGGRMGAHTKIEDYMIEFYAGLARYSGDLRPEELQALPKHVALAIKYHHTRLVVHGNVVDRIALNDNCFKVTKLNVHKNTTIHVVDSIAVPPNTNITSSPTRRGWSISSLTTLLSLSSSKSPSPPTPSSRTTPGRGLRHRVSMSLPGITSISGDPEVLVSCTLAPILESAFANRPTPIRSQSMITMLPSRAPFMDHVPAPSRHQREMDEDSDLSESEEEPILHLFSPTLLQTYDPRQDQPAVEEDT
jgi:hypothetical protein